ncbi:olfactory receptor 51E2-like [Ambystoma mexicanum]|uniref:olfactory receptor 51E2-like n=1 Tax=Ambystoma mexicanum TaxID=8296 RepID=UPI0037E7746A
MSDFNTSVFQPSTFVLTGVPGLESAHSWIGFSVCFMYIIALMANCAILFAVKTDCSLHEPMYILLCMLSLIDLILSSCTMPKMISLFWMDAKEMAFNACLTQVFFIHALSAMESSVLLAMSFDRYVAICHPLRHASILTNRLLIKVGLVAVGRSVLVFIPLPFLLNRLSFCRSNMLSHSYCLHQDVMKLSCVDATVNFVYGLFAILAVMGLDCVLILLSYILIVKTIVSLSSTEAGIKAINTCVSHLCAVLGFYIPLIGLSVVHRFGSTHTNSAIWMANVYLLVPPVLNPIVYGMQTRQIRQKILILFHHNTIHAERFP